MRICWCQAVVLLLSVVQRINGQSCPGVYMDGTATAIYELAGEIQIVCIYRGQEVVLESIRGNKYTEGSRFAYLVKYNSDYLSFAVVQYGKTVRRFIYKHDQQCGSATKVDETLTNVDNPMQMRWYCSMNAFSSCLADQGSCEPDHMSLAYFYDANCVFARPYDLQVQGLDTGVPCAGNRCFFDRAQQQLRRVNNPVKHVIDIFGAYKVSIIGNDVLEDYLDGTRKCLIKLNHEDNAKKRTLVSFFPSMESAHPNHAVELSNITEFKAEQCLERKYLRILMRDGLADLQYFMQHGKQRKHEMTNFCDDSPVQIYMAGAALAVSMAVILTICSSVLIILVKVAKSRMTRMNQQLPRMPWEATLDDSESTRMETLGATQNISAYGTVGSEMTQVTGVGSTFNSGTKMTTTRGPTTKGTNTNMTTQGGPTSTSMATTAGGTTAASTNPISE